MLPKCPLCDDFLILEHMDYDDFMCNELVLCTACDGELEVVSLNPLRLEPAPPVEEDWGE